MFLSVMSLVFVLASANRDVGKDDRTGPIATSGGAQITEIRIVRGKAAYASKKADLTNMSVMIWLPEKWTPEKWTEKREFLVKLNVDPVHDDVGTKLTSAERLKDIRFLNDEVIVGKGLFRKGVVGPVVNLHLDAPARLAQKIRALKGRAEVSPIELTTLSFDNILALEGKALDHPKLKDLHVRPTFEVNHGETTVSVRVAPGKAARIVDWWLEHRGEALSSTSETATLIKGEVARQKSFRGEMIKGYSLRMTVAEPIDTRVFEFDFGNVDLP